MTTRRNAKSQFDRVPAADWCLKIRDGHRKQMLLNGPGYEEIVQQIVQLSTLACLKRESLKCCRRKRNCPCQKRMHKKEDCPKFFRVLVVLKVDASTVDLFHNSSSGYRAQFYSSKDRGDDANRYLIGELIPKIQELLKSQPKRTLNPKWVLNSLCDNGAKAWIHQGNWLHHAKRQDYKLHVQRWRHAESAAEQEKCRKNAKRGGLIPDNEVCIKIMGGWLDPSGNPLGSLKLHRSKELHELGYT